MTRFEFSPSPPSPMEEKAGMRRCLFFKLKSPNQEPTPLPDLLPSHRMGAERQQQADANCFMKACKQTPDSGVQCADLWRQARCLSYAWAGRGCYTNCTFNRGSKMEKTP